MLDGGLYRAPRPAEKRTVSRQEPARQSVDEPLQADEPKIPHHSAPHHIPKKEHSPKRLIVLLAAALVIVVLGVIGWLAMRPNTPSTGAAIDSSKYQAVFFTNGQVYFGKLQAFNDDYMKLSDVFYLQTKEAASGSENPQQTAKNSSNDVQLVKLGNEIHGPQDEMVISKDQMLFFENLKSDGKVTGSIGQYKKSNK